MAVTPLKALLFAAGASVAVVGVAYVSGALDPLFKPEPPAGLAAAPSQPAGQQAPEEEASTASGTQARLPSAAEPEAMKPAESQGGTMKPAEPQGGAMKPAGEALSAAAKVTAPTFDVVRVEGNGSMVVAGNAAPNARVEVVHGATVLGTTTAGPDGAFAIVMEDPLKPGDYQLVLRATTPDNVAATSEQTAVVSIPEKQGGQVLAMVEEPGKASELLTVPEPEKKAEAEVSANGQAEAPQAPAAEAAQPPAATTAQEPQPAPADQAAAPATAEPASATAAPAKDVAGPTVVVEAVEIDGQKIFVAGLADPGRKVRAYANDLLLGDAQTSPDGHFLVEAKRDLPVGEYTIRVDALDADGAKVVARAAVPFQREPGDAIAAVAPSGEAKPAGTQGAEAGSAEAKPAETAAQPAAPAQTEPEASGAPAVAQAPADAAASPTVPETVSPKLEHADGAVIIRRGDTLWRISRRVYGHGIRYSTIYLANQEQIRDPDRIWPGQVFKVPETSREGEKADMKAMGDQMTAPQPAQ